MPWYGEDPRRYLTVGLPQDILKSVRADEGDCRIKHIMLKLQFLKSLKGRRENAATGICMVKGESLKWKNNGFNNFFAKLGKIEDVENMSNCRGRCWMRERQAYLKEEP